MAAGEKSKDSVSLLPCFYFVEMPILLSCAVGLYFLEWSDLFRPVLVGFSCRDPSLSLPYVEPPQELIPLLVLLSLAFAGPAISIMVGEAVLFCCQARKSHGTAAEANINAAGCNFNSFIRRAVRFIGVHTFGLCATALITNVLQLSTGSPAPYFLSVCKANYSSRNSSCEQSPYVLEDICTGADQGAISQARRSFPSQHATLASFAAVYVSMYFNSTLTDSSKLLKPLLVFSYTISAIVCGLTRIIQYRNHAIDVYLGFLLGSAVAVYLGLFAVGNFRPSKEAGGQLPPVLHYPPCSLTHVSQEAVLHHLKLKASLAGEAPAEGPLHQPQRLSKKAKQSAEAVAAGSAPHRDASVAFSHTLPRVHTPQAMAAYEEAARCHAATLHRASMDSSRSKQLLSQWKSRNPHGCSLQLPDFFSSSVDSASSQASLRLPHHSSSETLSGGLEQKAHLCRLPAGASTTLPSNCSGIAGGARVLLQSRPGSSQLVHIPEEGQESSNGASPRPGAQGNEGSAAQKNWQVAAEQVLGLSQKAPARLLQMASAAKQQALLHSHSKSLDECSADGHSAAAFQGSAHYQALSLQEPASGPGLSSAGSTASLAGSSAAVVRVEAHPENQPGFHAASSDAAGSWRWRSLDHGTGVGVGPGPRGALPAAGAGGGNDAGRDSESSDSVSESSVGRKQANHVSAGAGTAALGTVHTQKSGLSEQSRHQQNLSTIRVTPGDGGSSACGAGADGASSAESKPQKKATNRARIPERTHSPEPAGSYRAASIPPGFTQ